MNFSIKTVNPNTVAAEVGLLPGDRIVQVSYQFVTGQITVHRNKIR